MAAVLINALAIRTDEMKPSKLNKEPLRPLTGFAKPPKAQKMIPMKVKTGPNSPRMKQRVK